MALDAELRCSNFSLAHLVLASESVLTEVKYQNDGNYCLKTSVLEIFLQMRSFAVFKLHISGTPPRPKSVILFANAI